MRWTFALFLIVLSSCTLPASPDVPYFVPPPTDYYDYYLDHSPLPSAHYDGIFTSIVHYTDYLDTNNIDTASTWYESQAMFYNELGDVIESPSDNLSVSVNGTMLRFFPYYSFDTNLDLRFPQPVTWELHGDSFFPSFTHTINTEIIPSITSPILTDTLSASKSFDILYYAPAADTVTVTLEYDGIGQYKQDTTDQQRDIIVFNRSQHLNSGIFTVPPFVPDLRIQSFTPETIDVTIAWAVGDTMNVQGKHYGFVTEAVANKEYNLKP